MTPPDDRVQQVSSELEHRSEGGFRAEAFALILDSLSRCLHRPDRAKREQIPATELAKTAAEIMRERYGAFARGVWECWGVHSTLDIGRVVHEMARYRVLSLGQQDSLDGFRNLFSFAAYLDAPYSAEPPFPDMPAIR